MASSERPECRCLEDVGVDPEGDPTRIFRAPQSGTKLAQGCGKTLEIRSIGRRRDVDVLRHDRRARNSGGSGSYQHVADSMAPERAENL